MSDTVGFLLQSAGRYPVLSHERQLLLARQVRAWLSWPSDSGPCPSTIEARGRRAKERLIQTNLRLVVSQAARFRHIWQQHPDAYSDLIQEGCFGLNRAIEKFDPARGYCLSTYCIPWIRQSIGRSIPYITDSIRRPGHIHDQWRKLSRLISNYESENGVRPSVEWLSEHSGLSEREVRHTIVCGQMRVTSLDQITRGSDDADGSTLADLIPDERSISPDEQLDNASRIDYAHQLLEQLPDKERYVIHSIYFENTPQIECSEHLGVCRARIGQLRLKALERMRGDRKFVDNKNHPARDCSICGTNFIPSIQGLQVCSPECRAERKRRGNRLSAQRKKRQLVAA